VINARVTVTLKNGVLDPQGKAIEGALGALGFDSIGHVRQGQHGHRELHYRSRLKVEGAVS
jgi:phosphoribosylformylglycinamidine synthase